MVFISCAAENEVKEDELKSGEILKHEAASPADEKKKVLKKQESAAEKDTVYLREIEEDIDESTAYINEIEGLCLLQRKNTAEKWENAELYLPLYEGDRISTKDNSIAEIVFDDSTIIVLEPQSDITIKNLVRGDENRTIISLISGKLMAIVKKLKKSDEFAVATKMALAAVKGTEFAVEVSDRHYVGVFGGEVEVAGYDSAGKPAGRISVKPNYETYISEKMREPAKTRRLSRRMLERRDNIGKYRSRIERIRSLKTGGDLQKYRMERMLRRMDEYSEIKKDRKRYDSLSDIEKMRIDSLLSRKSSYEKRYDRLRRLETLKKGSEENEEEKEASPFRRHR